jgi:hypothetical protein
MNMLNIFIKTGFTLLLFLSQEVLIKLKSPPITKGKVTNMHFLDSSEIKFAD